MQHHGATEEPWITAHQSKRPILSSDRLPGLHLSHLSASGNPDATGVSSDHCYSSHFSTPKQTLQSNDIGLKTPSPSPTSLAMNQQQQGYTDAHHSMSAGQQYAPQGTTAGGMAPYSSYQHHNQQPSVLQPGHGGYTQSPATHYQHYGYPTGMASPHGSSQSLSSSIPSHMTPGLPPLPGQY